MATDVEEAIGEWKKGFVSGLYNLSIYYDLGHGVERDYAKRNDLLRQAALLGYGPALNNYGWNHRIGDGIEKNARLAMYWFRIAALQWNPLALQNMAEMLESGEGIERDPEAAFNIYLRTAILDLAAIETLMALETGAANAIAECRVKVAEWCFKARLPVVVPQRPLGIAMLQMAMGENRDVDDADEIGRRARGTQEKAEAVLTAAMAASSAQDRSTAEEMTATWPSVVLLLRESTPLPQILLLPDR